MNPVTEYCEVEALPRTGLSRSTGAILRLEFVHLGRNEHDDLGEGLPMRPDSRGVLITRDRLGRVAACEKMSPDRVLVQLAGKALADCVLKSARLSHV